MPNSHFQNVCFLQLRVTGSLQKIEKYVKTQALTLFCADAIGIFSCSTHQHANSDPLHYHTSKKLITNDKKNAIKGDSVKK